MCWNVCGLENINEVQSGFGGADIVVVSARRYFLAAAGAFECVEAGICPAYADFRL